MQNYGNEKKHIRNNDRAKKYENTYKTMAMKKNTKTHTQQGD